MQTVTYILSSFKSGSLQYSCMFFLLIKKYFFRISELILDHPMYRDALHRNTRSIPMEDTFQTVTSSRCTEGTLIPTVPTAEDGFISQGEF